MISTPKIIPLPAVKMPEKEIFIRLRTRMQDLPESDYRRIVEIMRRGFGYCRFRGCFCEADIKVADGVITLNDAVTWKSEKLSANLADCRKLIIFGVTAGREIVERSIAAFDNAVASDGAIFDAVGSESVEASADALEDYLRRQYARTGQVLVKRRFSPGYGDWALTAQKDIFNILPMDKIGVKLSPELIMAPEKSITAVIGIINPGDAKDNE